MRPRRFRLSALAFVVALLTASIPVQPAVAVTTTDVSQRYLIRATLDVAAGRLDAFEELELTNRSHRTIDHVNLSVVPRGLDYFSMDDVVVDGQPVATEWTTSINLRVPLADLAPGAFSRIEIGFSLDVGRSPDAFTARTSRENGVLSFGQWFPILSTEHDIYGLGDPQISFSADAIRLELETTSSLPRDSIACPGLESAPETSGMSWTCESTDVRDFSFVVNPRFGLATRDADGIDVRVYAETVSGARTADLAAEALIGLAEAFGPYPWPDLVLAEVGSGGGFSMEYPRMIHLTRDKVADPYVVYHEVAHQWFYAQVGNDQQREPWLDEAFADFSARYLMGIGENACSTRPVDSEVFAWEAGATTGGDWTSCDGYFHAVFYQGTAFLNEVQDAMGEEGFFSAMREWVEDNQHGFVTGRELLLHLRRSTDADLLPIYERYLDDPDPRAPRLPIDLSLFSRSRPMLE